jgi:hypothetical protein
MLEQCAVWLGRHVTIRGSGRLVSALFPCRPNAQRYVRGVRARDDGLLMELDSRNWIDWNLLFRGGFEFEIGRLLRTLAPSGAVAVDIGANIGAHALSLAQAVGPAGTVLAFEPNPPVRAVLERNLALKQDSAEYSNMGLASLVALDTPHDLVDVPVRRLDDVFEQAALPRCDVVKIDVQGYECAVLAGMAGILDRYKPAVVFEYERWAWAKASMGWADAVKVLDSAGYRLWRHEASRLIPVQDAASIPDYSDLVAFWTGDPRLRLLRVDTAGGT